MNTKVSFHCNKRRLTLVIENALKLKENSSEALNKIKKQLKQNFAKKNGARFN